MLRKSYINNFIATVTFVAFLQLLYCHAFKVRSFEETMTLFTRCAVRYKVPRELTNEYMKMNFPNDDKTRCFVKCAVLNLDLFDKHKGFDVKATVAQLRNHPIKNFYSGSDISTTKLEEYQKILQESPKVVEKVTQCNTMGKNTTDACYWAFNTFTCSVREIRQLLHV